MSDQTGSDEQGDVNVDGEIDARVGTGVDDRTRRRFFGSLCGMVVLVNLARVVFAPLLEPLIDAFSMSAGTAGFVVTLVWMGSAVIRIPTGVLLTRVGRQHVVLGTGAVLSVTAVVTAAANSVTTLAVSAFLLGLTSGAYFIAANPLVSELYPERVGRAIGIHGTASQLAAVAAPLFVGATLVVGTWRTAFLVLAALAAVATGVLFQVARRAETLPKAGQSDRAFLAATRRQWPIIASAVAIVGSMGFVWNGMFNFYVTYLTQVKLLDPNTARVLLTLVFATGALAFWLTGRLADRLPHVPLLLSIIGGFVTCLVALTVAQSLLALAVVTAVLGYVVHSLYPAIDTYLLDSLPDENRASAYATYSGLAVAISATGSWVLGSLTEFGFDFDTLFIGAATGLTVVLAVLVGLRLAGRLPSDATTT